MKQFALTLALVMPLVFAMGAMSAAIKPYVPGGQKVYTAGEIAPECDDNGNQTSAAAQVLDLKAADAAKRIIAKYPAVSKDYGHEVITFGEYAQLWSLHNQYRSKVYELNMCLLHLIYDLRPVDSET